MELPEEVFMGNVMSSEIFSAEIRRLEEGNIHTHTHRLQTHPLVEHREGFGAH